MSRVLRRVIAAAPFLLSGNLGRFRPGTENALPAGLTASMKELKVRRSHHRILKRSNDRPIKARESAPWKSYENFNISGRRARSPRVSHKKRMKKRERTILSRKHSGLSLRKNRRKAPRRSRKRRKRRRIACQQMREQPGPIPQLLPSLLLFNGLKEVPQAPMNNHQATTPQPFLSVDCTLGEELPPSLTLKGGSPADAPTLDQPENPASDHFSKPFSASPSSQPDELTTPNDAYQPTTTAGNAESLEASQDRRPFSALFGHRSGKLPLSWDYINSCWTSITAWCDGCTSELHAKECLALLEVAQKLVFETKKSLFNSPDDPGIKTYEANKELFSKGLYSLVEKIRAKLAQVKELSVKEARGWRECLDRLALLGDLQNGLPLHHAPAGSSYPPWRMSRAI